MRQAGSPEAHYCERDHQHPMIGSSLAALCAAGLLFLNSTTLTAQLQRR